MIVFSCFSSCANVRVTYTSIRPFVSLVFVLMFSSTLDAFVMRRSKIPYLRRRGRVCTHLPIASGRFHRDPSVFYGRDAGINLSQFANELFTWNELPPSSINGNWIIGLNNVFPLPLLFSLIAGLSTCLGAAVVFLIDYTSADKSILERQQFIDKQLSFSLSLAGSVMVTVSLASIVPEAFYDASSSTLLNFGSATFLERILSIAAGCGLFLSLSEFILPKSEEVLAHDDDLSVERKISDYAHVTPNTVLSVPGVAATRLQDSDLSSQSESRRAWRLAMILFVSLALHNFPEGLAVAASTVHSEKLGITTTVAIALHNIPEGIAISIPSMKAHPESPWLAFGLASLSGLSEPLGAAFALAVISSQNEFSDETKNISFYLDMNNVLAFVGGVMTTVALRELFPEAWRYSKNSKFPFLFGALSGVLIMLLTESYLNG